MDAISDRGSTGDLYNQNSRNFAAFTHNIFHVTDRFDVTVGLRYTTERKKLDATFGNDNIACVQNQAALTAVGALNPASPLFAIGSAIAGLSCQGNTTAELNGVSINGKRTEHRLTGTGVLSYKVTDDLLAYASYSRGYKAGGFNLDRSALKVPIFTFASLGGAQALAPGLQFDPEIVDAFELGGKYSARGLTVNLSLFRQQFKNFQLNTFDGTVFIVQNINGCTDSLGVTDEDQSRFSGGANFVPPAGSSAAALTGVCSSDSVGYGVRSQGLELETSYRLMSDLRVNAGVTVAKTSYRSDLVGTDNGAPLNPALRRLPGRRLSNAPGFVATGAIANTPAIG
jgi:outer membrane receptor protein involved in Fe transport